MNKTYEFYCKLVSQINTEYSELHGLTNDELRLKLSDIEKCISSCEDKSHALEQHLVQVYAIVKETARRFSQGDIVVDNEDKNHLVDVDALLKDIALSIDEKYVIATSNVGISMLDDKTYLDISVWNEDELVNLRINYDFENLTVLNSEAI